MSTLITVDGSPVNIFDRPFGRVTLDTATSKLVSFELIEAGGPVQGLPQHITLAVVMSSIVMALGEYILPPAQSKLTSDLVNSLLSLARLDQEPPAEDIEWAEAGLAQAAAKLAVIRQPMAAAKG